MSAGLPRTLSRILKPLLCASVIMTASATALGTHLTWRLTQYIPAYFILSAAEKSLTCPPSSKAPDPDGGGEVAGGVVAAGGGVAVATGPLPGSRSTWPTKIRSETRLLACLSAATLVLKRWAMAHSVSPRWTT